MQIKKMSKEAYIKLIDYIFQICDIIGLKKYSDAHSKTTQKIINIIKKDIPINFTNIDKCINQIYEKYINDCEIFNKKYIEHFESFTSNIYIAKNRKMVLKEAIYQYLYNILTNDFILKHQKKIYLKKENINYGSNYDISSYYFKIDKNLKQEMQNKSSIFDWRFPLTLEDICFFNKNGLCWLWSVSHEEVYEICFQETEEKEYEYLKSIGIEFVEKEFTPTPKEYLYYLEDYLKD